ncbi:dnaJ homolog subfamily C member 17-like [Anthonomus grandis grandis]|uniref:dnaJ homolog subfamily C member 17-like n=1 Tax=Anthonomus grandis grandis TaxID=2921223 RepID=UPI0021660891|nr:dnaJ homolog subfamily C member 17-like [Anthonomus grandis grandis]
MEDLKIEEMDLYEILEIEFGSTAEQIKKAYRKKALQCHPDKNPDDPNAAKKFHQLSKILEVLTDVKAREAYDRVLKGRKEAAIRHRELDGKRRKLKEDLEERERLAAGGGYKHKSEAQKLREEIERLRKEGSKQVEEEIQNILRTIHEETPKSEWDSSNNRIKIKWNSEKKDPNNGGYTRDLLHRFLSKYGDIQALVLSPKRKGSALVEFKEQKAAEMAVELEVGLPENPLRFEWINGAPQGAHKPKSDLIKDSDFESVTLMNLRRAEERKKLIEQMMADEDES